MNTLLQDLVALHNSYSTSQDEYVGVRYDLRRLIERHAPEMLGELNNEC